MSDLPPELITTILSRLAVKPLLRFKSVSKPWLALIESPDFIKLHLNHSIQTDSHRFLILRGDSLLSLHLDSLKNLTEINHPLNCEELGIDVVGSTNGLLCLCIFEEDIVLWNPSTQTHLKLPLTEIDFPGRCQLIVYGFGYDHVNDDYKVVEMIQFTNLNGSDSFRSEVNVYSLKSKLWERVGDFPYYLRYIRAHGVFSNGALHWVVSKTVASDKRNFIAAFDLVTGEYRLVAQPAYSDADFYMKVGVLGGCLCVISNCYMRVDIWVLKEYGVKESWTKLLSLVYPIDIRAFEVLLPLAYSKRGDKVLFEKDNTGFVWYDLKRKKVKNARVGGLPHFFESKVCMESLVKLPGSAGGK